MIFTSGLHPYAGALDRAPYQDANDLLSSVLKIVASGSPQSPLLCRYSLLFSFDTWFLVVFPLAQLCQYPRLFTKLFEASDSALDGFVLSNPDSGH